MAGKENRYVIKHATKGLYLGNGCWSKGPEAAAINCVPTYSAADLSGAEVQTVLKGGQGPTGAWASLVGHELIDTDANRISQETAVFEGLADERWCMLPTCVEG